MFGMVRNVQVCPDCHGSGKIIKDKCTDCRGTGYQTKLKTIQVTIPAGIDNGQSIRIRGRVSLVLTAASGVIFLLRLQYHSIRSLDVRTTIFSQQCQYLLYRQRLVQRLELIQLTVRWSMSLKQELRTDTQVRLRGKGVPSLRNKNVRGDHYVTFVVQVPTSMTKEQKRHCRHLMRR